MNEKLITVTSYGRGAGSARVRVFDWLDHLSLIAHTYDYLGTASSRVSDIVRAPLATLAAERQLRALAEDLGRHTVLLSRQASPFSNGAIEAALLARAARGVYDFDDALFSYPERGATTLWSKRRIWARATQAADVVIAGNDYLANHAEQYAKEVVVIPSCVEPSQYQQKTSYDIAEPPKAVWLGSPSTERYLQSISRALLEANRTLGLTLTVISAGEQSLGPLDAIVTRVQWDPRTMPQILADADFGVMPLEDNSWTRGKCAYKLLQYGASGLPLVGDPVGANAAVLRGAGAHAPANEDEWLAAFEDLTGMSPMNREKLGTGARLHVEANYSYGAWGETWRGACGIPR